MNAMAPQWGQRSAAWPGCSSEGSQGILESMRGIIRVSSPGCPPHTSFCSSPTPSTERATWPPASSSTTSARPLSRWPGSRSARWSSCPSPSSSGTPGRRLSRADRWNVFWYGVVLGFAAAFGFGNWGMARSTATNAALLITVEPISLILLSPLFLGERLSGGKARRRPHPRGRGARRGRTAFPGVSVALAPHWRGDILLLSGLSYAAYSLIGRGVLAPPCRAARDRVVHCLGRCRPCFPSRLSSGPTAIARCGRPVAIWGTLYLAVVVTALGYPVWNYCLERVEAPRLALFVNVQPLVGALLGVWWLREPLTVFMVTGGLLVLLGLHLTVRAGRMV